MKWTHIKRENNMRIYRERIREVNLEKTNAYMLGKNQLTICWKKSTNDMLEKPTCALVGMVEGSPTEQRRRKE